MPTAIKSNNIPEQSIILKDFGKVNYLDSFHIYKDTEATIDSITVNVFKGPKWVGSLMKVRDSIVGIFGLKTAKKKNSGDKEFYPIGSKIDFFTVVDRNDNEIVMAENDKHLNFRTSVMIERNGTHTSVHLSTIVKFNNIFGRLYFIPVKPFHRLIIKSILKKFAETN